ncbi:MAG: sporulation protein YqfD [Clostridia bacterium]|nr:sporulation protein YqfD [Clostridia bacterium]MDD4047810.1 sporulation protein YqfD [Clostridia bacterium]
MKWIVKVTGYLEVILNGNNPERVINMALSRGIHIWDIKQTGEKCYKLKVSIGGYKALRYLIRRSSCKAKIVAKRGMPFLLMRAQRRKLLVVGAFLFCIIIYILGSFIWFIEITGNEKISTNIILSKVQEYGLKRGVPKASLKSKVIKEKLLLEIPELSWVGVHIQGTKIIIEVAEKTLMLDSDKNKPADLIACLDGEIEELLVLTGTSLVKEGDKVKKGQTLIAGLFYSHVKILENGTIVPDGEAQKVRARGLVRARVIRNIIAECPVIEKTIRDTGVGSSVVLIKVMGKEIYLKGKPKVPYKNYREICHVKQLFNIKGRIIKCPVELITVIYKEQTCKINNWKIEGAYKEAIRRAKKKITNTLPTDCRIISQKYEPISNKEKELVVVKYILETIENIGTYKNQRLSKKKMY